MSTEAKREVWVIEELGRIVKCDTREPEMSALADLYNACRGSTAPQAKVVRYVPAVEQACAVPAPAVEAWQHWTQDAAEELQEATSAWLVWRGIVQHRPYTWLFDENGEGCWFCAAPDGDERIVHGVQFFMPIPLPPLPKASR